MRGNRLKWKHPSLPELVPYLRYLKLGLLRLSLWSPNSSFFAPSGSRKALATTSASVVMYDEDSSHAYVNMVDVGMRQRLAA